MVPSIIINNLRSGQAAQLKTKTLADQSGGGTEAMFGGKQYIGSKLSR